MLSFIIIWILSHISSNLIFLYIALCIPFWIQYCIGMAEYFTMNHVSDREEEKKKVWKSVLDEYLELMEEINKRDIVGIFMESADVLHVFIKYIFTCYLPFSWMKKSILWIPIFWIAQPTTIKHGKRYFFTKCIRNHNNANNLNHKCKHN